MKRNPPGGTVQAPASAGPARAAAWTEIPAPAGYTALCLPLSPPLLTHLVTYPVRDESRSRGGRRSRTKRRLQSSSPLRDSQHFRRERLRPLPGFAALRLLNAWRQPIRLCCASPVQPSQGHEPRGLVGSLPRQPCPQGPPARSSATKPPYWEVLSWGTVRPLRQWAS